ncbi:HAMP domain-containing protein, partial [Salmonella enterica]|uniref:HAMP domain-containing protein n=1 Tax=Salmonella enterica TaxID=28901 RepID=UPI0032980B50
RLFHPLARLIAGAGRIAHGDYRHRVEEPEEDEVAQLALALNHLAQRVEDQLQEAGAERDHLSTILASMSEGVLVVDREGRAQLANPS